MTSDRIFVRTHARLQRGRVGRLRKHRGSIYVAVLGTAMIVSMIALAAIHSSRAEIDRLVSADQIASAETLAQSAVELALTRLANDSTWRTTYSSGVEVPAGSSWFSLGAGEVKFILVDDDGDLEDDSKDSVTLYGVGRRGEATSVVSVQLQPGGSALNCLDAAMHAGTGIALIGSTLTCNQMVSANGDVLTFTGTFATDVWSTGTIIGTVTGMMYQLESPAREMPDSNSLFDYYLANGTPISYSSLTSGRMENIVLSANSNPYGATNPQGIYVIDTQGQQLRIRNARIEATLVVLSPSNTTLVEQRIHWEPPAASLPALLIRGGVEMKWDGGSALSEATVGVNLNPAGTPYLGGSDNDTSDTYPGVIQGLVYASGGFYASSTCTMEGTVVAGGSITAGAAINMTYRPVDRNNPPPGFAGGNGVRIVPGTWKRAAR